MSDFINIRGYAVPFGKPVPFGEEVECINRKAFDRMLNRDGPAVPIVWGSHERSAPVIASTPNTAGLFTDDYGLGFWARLDMRDNCGRMNDNWDRLRAMTARKDPMDRCSIQFNIKSTRIEQQHGSDCAIKRVLEAEVEHIAIVSDAAYGGWTGVWPTDCSIEEAPWRIREMSARWQVGHDLFHDLVHLQAKRRTIFNAAVEVKDGKGLGPGGDLSDQQLAVINACCARIAAIDREIASLR